MFENGVFSASAVLTQHARGLASLVQSRPADRGPVQWCDPYMGGGGQRNNTSAAGA